MVFTPQTTFRAFRAFLFRSGFDSPGLVVVKLQKSEVVPLRTRVAGRPETSPGTRARYMKEVCVCAFSCFLFFYQAPKLHDSLIIFDSR